MNSKKYPAALECIAEEFHVPMGTVLNMYELELMSLRTNARILSYLSVLATKHVKMALWKERLYHDGRLKVEYGDEHLKNNSG